MTREEEVITACKGFLSRYPSIDQAGLSIGFLDGAVWADKHPKNVWHDASEKPSMHKTILIQCGYPLHTYEATALSEDVIWGDFVVLNAIFRWAYIKDLLPKGGAK